MFLDIMKLLIGVGVFLTAVMMFSAQLEKSASGGMQKVLKKISRNRFAGMGVGAGITAVTQSSAATTVMAIGLLNVGIISLFQATSIIIGSNVGTTLTALMLSFMSFGGVTESFMAMAFIGAIIKIATKKEVPRRIADILISFGMLFVGLSLMSGALRGSEQINGFFVNLFQEVNFPIWLILLGAGFTALLQSSTASTAIFLVMMAEGTLHISGAMYLVMGANIGSCIVAIIAALTANTNAKRAALIHFMFNFIGMIMLAAIVWPLGDIFINAYVRAIPDPMWQLSVFHLIFNTGTACVLIFFVTPLNKFATWAIKGKAEDASVMKTKFIDDHLLPTPAIAMEQLPKEILHMASKAKVNLGLAFDALVNQSLVNKEEINREEDYIDFLTRQIGRFIIKLSAQQISEDDELFVGSFHHVINDLERVGDYAIKMLSAAGRMRKHSQQFSKKASSELKKMFDKLMELYDVCIEIFETRNADKIKDAKKIDSEIDLMKSRLADAHLLWLKGGQYTAIGGEHFYAAVCDLERIADHLINIAYTTRALEDSELSGNEIAEEEQGKQAMADDEIQLEFALPATEIVKADLMDETSFIRNRD